MRPFGIIPGAYAEAIMKIAAELDREGLRNSANYVYASLWIAEHRDEDLRKLTIRDAIMGAEEYRQIAEEWGIYPGV